MLIIIEIKSREPDVCLEMSMLAGSMPSDCPSIEPINHVSDNRIYYQYYVVLFYRLQQGFLLAYRRYIKWFISASMGWNNSSHLICCESRITEYHPLSKHWRYSLRESTHPWAILYRNQWYRNKFGVIGMQWCQYQKKRKFYLVYQLTTTCNF